MPKQRMMRVLGAAIFMIVLSFASSVAQAHTGHEYHAAAQPGGGHGQTVSHQSAQPMAPATLQQTRWEQTETPTPAGRNCVGGCCFSACAACCAAGLPGFVQLVPLPRATSRIALARSEIRPNREPESLRRPPKSFT